LVYDLTPIAGVDEAGRGPLAGPVVAAALILPDGLRITGVQDSKTLSAKRRIQLADEIMAQAVAYSLGIVDAATIDRINIHHATLLAMKKAVEALELSPVLVLVDGKFAPALPYPTICMIRGDARSHLIAAASILAKVARDDMLLDLHQSFPQYGFDRHMGYPTVAHRTAIAEHGPSPYHRMSYRLK